MKWLLGIIRRWRAKRIRTKEIRDAYRTYEENKAKLENGEEL